MDAELVDKLVLQLNRIYPQILSDKEAHRVTTDNICFDNHHVLTLESAKRMLDLDMCSVSVHHVSPCSSGT